MKYRAHEYQEYATRFILEHPACALLLDMGLGKTIITLMALNELKSELGLEKDGFADQTVWQKRGKANARSLHQKAITKMKSQ